MTTISINQEYKTVVIEQSGPAVIIRTVGVGPQGPKGDPGPPKSITIAQPKPNDQFTLFFTQYETTLTQVIALVRGDTPSVTFELRYGQNRSLAGTLATAPSAVTNTTTGQIISIQNTPIPADNFLWILVTAVSGQVEEFNVSVEI
jgi:hypothetical protein